MARFFFNVRDGGKIKVDCVGHDLADAAGARQEACLIARDFVHRPSGTVSDAIAPWMMEVRDTRGRLVYAATFAQAARGPVTAQPQSPPPPDNAYGAAQIVHLDLVRTLRRNLTVENERRSLLLRNARLLDHNKYVRNSISYEITRAQEELEEARRTVKRSALQRNTG
jgi:hypothetical protein